MIKNPSFELEEKVLLEEPEKNINKLNEIFLKFDKNKNNYLSLE
jgi:hypothetical protein